MCIKFQNTFQGYMLEIRLCHFVTNNPNWRKRKYCRLFSYRSKLAFPSAISKWFSFLKIVMFSCPPPAQLCWSSSRLQPLQNNNLNKFAIIRPSNLHHNKNLWNCWGAPDETTCLTGFFRCFSALALICMKLFNICANNLSFSLSLSRDVVEWELFHILHWNGFNDILNGYFWCVSIFLLALHPWLYHFVTLASWQIAKYLQ